MSAEWAYHPVRNWLQVKWMSHKTNYCPPAAQGWGVLFLYSTINWNKGESFSIKTKDKIKATPLKKKKIQSSKRIQRTFLMKG